MKSLIISKRNAFKAKDQDRCKSIQKEINDKIKQCKYNYKDKIELKFKSMDSKGMWEGLKTMAGLKSTPLTIH